MQYIYRASVSLLESNLSRTAHKFTYCLGCPCDFLNILDDQTTTNMDVLGKMECKTQCLFCNLTNFLATKIVLAKQASGYVQPCKMGHTDSAL